LWGQLLIVPPLKDQELLGSSCLAGAVILPTAGCSAGTTMERPRIIGYAKPAAQSELHLISTPLR